MLVSACTPTLATRGNLVKDEQIQNVKLGFHTRSDVLRYMGSPTAKAPFDDNKWYYIGQETEKKGILDEEVEKERIVVVSFNEQGVVQDIQDETADRLDIPYDRKKTQTHGNSLTFFEQLVGNVGRFNTRE